MDVLDHSSRAFTYGSKVGFDATRKLPEEGFTRDWPDVIEMDDDTKRRVDAMWSRLRHRRPRGQARVPDGRGVGLSAAGIAAHDSREGQTFEHRGSRWLVYVNFVKLPHTLFALPFALVGVVLAS
jgi:hypothetical protein